jgi:hypothetical protein
VLCDFVEISSFFLVLDRSVPLLFRCFLLGFLAFFGLSLDVCCFPNFVSYFNIVLTTGSLISP